MTADGCGDEHRDGDWEGGWRRRAHLDDLFEVLEERVGHADAVAAEVVQAKELPVLGLAAEVPARHGVGHRLLSRARGKGAAALVAVRIPPGAAILDIVPAARLQCHAS